MPRLYEPRATDFAIVLGRPDPAPRLPSLVVDLGDAIGSRTWWRGFATLAAGIAALVHLAPGIAPPPLPVGASIRAAGVVPATRGLPDRRGATRGPRIGPTPASLPIAAAPLRIVAPVGTSLYRTLRGAGVPLPVLADYLRAIEPRVDVGEILAGDAVDLVVERGRLVYAGLNHDGEPLRLLRWTLDGREQWLDAAGAGEARGGGFAMPVAGRLSSGFGMRFHPILGYSRMHQGVDLAAPYGAPIVAASDGVVRFAGWHGGHGNYVLLAHAGGLATGYGHMSAITVAPGRAVRQGELIGTVGATGLATGPHLHFEVFRDGVAIDPATANFIATAPRLSGAALAAFEARLARLTALPAG